MERLVTAGETSADVGLLGLDGVGRMFGGFVFVESSCKWSVGC